MSHSIPRRKRERREGEGEVAQRTSRNFDGDDGGYLYDTCLSLNCPRDSVYLPCSLMCSDGPCESRRFS